MARQLLTATQLATFTDGVANLARAGAPLERGMVLLREDTQQVVGAAISEINEKLESGGSLHEIIAADDRFPRSYSAILEVGMRSGRLAAAMEPVSTVLRRASELRRSMIAAMVYPFMVLLVAYLVALFIFVYWAPEVMTHTGDVTSMFRPLKPFFLAVSSYALYVAPVVPAVVALFLVYWSYRSSRSYFSPRMGLVTSGIQPEGRYAIFAEVLALLLDCETPLPQAVRLAAECTGDKFMAAEGVELATQLEQGEVSKNEQDSTETSSVGIPPLLRWLVVSAPQQQNLVATLRRSASDYHERAAQNNEWYTTRLPAYLSIGVGGSIAAILAFCVIGPWAYIMIRVGLPESIWQ